MQARHARKDPTMQNKSFHPHPADAAGVLSWVHFGDLHMTAAGEQNDLDLQAIVATVNRLFAGSVAFAFLPGDVADDGSREAYAVVRNALAPLSLPWCSIVGDHDVQQHSFHNYLEAMSGSTHFAFTVGNTRFLAMNAFDVPKPSSFTVSPQQLRWAEEELQKATEAEQRKILLLHCYPTDLKQGADEVQQLIRQYDVLLVDMGHTHYNEIANDGRTLYTATRSTGQIEEGPVGFSVTNLDGDAVSWRFVEPDETALVMICSPADERLTPDGHSCAKGSIVVRAKVWCESAATHVTADLGTAKAALARVEGSNVWQGTLNAEELATGRHLLRVVARTQQGHVFEDRIWIWCGERPVARRLSRDQENAIGAWPEHGLLGTQLGPNKNGRKW
jgi:3',5'-cyclic-AMP phosphodiesterase